MNRICCIAFFAVLSVFLFFSCASSPSAESSSESEFVVNPGDAVQIATPPMKERSFFASVNSDAVLALENGSPDSIRNAYSLVRKEISLYSESEKVFLNVLKNVMEIVWPSEWFVFECPDANSANAYLGAIESSKQGIYDRSANIENADFLTLVLPSLVLLTSGSRTDYYAESEAALKNALLQKSDSVLANYLLGVLYRRQEKFSDALPYFKEAFSGAENCSEAMYAYAHCDYMAGNFDSSLLTAESLSLKFPENKDALKLCAEISFAKGDYNKAEQYVARILQQEPDNSYYILFRAKILVQKGDYIRAVSLLDVYARTDTDNRDYLYLRAMIQKNWNRNVTAALSTIEKAISLYPDDTEIILAAAQIASETGTNVNGMSATELSSRVLQKEPGSVTALEIQVDDFVKKRQWQEAYAVSSELMKNSSVSDSSIYTHISICLSAGREQEAWELVSSLYDRAPTDENVLQNYIKVLIALGRNSEANAIISSLLDSASARMKSFLYYERSFLVTSEDDILENLRSSLISNPRNRDSLFRLYEIYFRKREYRKAQYYLKQVVALSPSDMTLLQLNSELEALLSR